MTPGVYQGLTIASASLGFCVAFHGAACGCAIGADLDDLAAMAAQSPPAANHRDIAEQGGLYGQRIVARHVALRVDASKNKRRLVHAPN